MSVAPADLFRLERSDDDPRDWRLLALTIVALALLASATSLANGFAYDDRWIIVDNKHVHSLLAPWGFFRQTYWPFVTGAALYRPLTILSYAIEWALGTGSPAVFHVVNVVLYAMLSVLVLALAQECLPRRAAWIAAALFAVHPVHVEAVGNVVGQAELWTGVVMVGATLYYLRQRRGGLPLTREAKVVLVGLYFLGMMYKENAIVIPALLLAAEWFLVDDRRPFRERADGMVSLLVWMGLFAAIFLLIRVDILHEIGGDISHPSLRHKTIVERSFIMLGLAPEFGRLFLWPAHLYADYSPRAVPILPSPDIGHIPGAVYVLCVTILFAVSARRAPVVAFGLAWVAISMAPTMNILIPTGILIAERTLMVPSVGVVLAVASCVPWVEHALAPRPHVLRVLAGGAVATVLTLGAAWSADRQRTWKDSNTVFRTMAHDMPLNFKAHYVLGGMYFDQHRSADGEREWHIAIFLMPGYYGVYADLGHKYREGHLCQAAVAKYNKALEIEEGQPEVWAGLVACHLELAHYKMARSLARRAIADEFAIKAFRYMINVADSALVATDSLDGANRWKPKAKPRPKTAASPPRKSALTGQAVGHSDRFPSVPTRTQTAIAIAFRGSRAVAGVTSADAKSLFDTR